MNEDPGIQKVRESNLESNRLPTSKERAARREQIEALMPKRPSLTRRQRRAIEAAMRSRKKRERLEEEAKRQRSHENHKARRQATPR